MAPSRNEITFERAETPPSPSSNVPFRRDPDFLDRPVLTERIHAGVSAPAGRVALVGLGGVGKSQLAVEYARQVRQRSPQTWVLWIHASNAARFDVSVRDVPDQLKLHGRRDPKTDLLQLLRSRLCDESKGRWMVVLDNADDASVLCDASATSDEARAGQRPIDYIPTCDHGSVLITSRSRSEALRLVYEREVIEILPMSEGEAERLLSSKLGQSSPEDGRLVRALECMPLAITQAAAYIREQTPWCSVGQYCEELERSRVSRTGLLRREAALAGRDVEARNSVLLTWQISFDHIHKTRRSAAELLSSMSFYDRLAIPETLLRAGIEGGETSVSTNDTSEIGEDLRTLRNFSFASRTTEKGTWEMHRLVQDATQLWLEDHRKLEEVREKVIHCLNAVLPDGSFEDWPQCRVLFPHARRLAEQRPQSESAVLEWAAILYKSASYARQQGDFDDALQMATLSMTTRLERLGGDSEATLSSMSIVASTYSNQGRWKEAEELEVKVMETSRRVLGLEHPDTLRSMNNLASTYWNQGRWKEAEELEVKVVETSRRVLGLEHPDTLRSMNNLASTYRNQGRWKEAEELEVKVMETMRRVLGLEHPDTLRSMNNLASTYWNQGRWKEAEELFVKVMETIRRVLGLEHPDTLTSMNNLPSTYGNQGRWADADKLLVETVEGRKNWCGPQHPHTLQAISSLEHVRRMRRQGSSSHDLAHSQHATQRAENEEDVPAQTRGKLRWRWPSKFSRRRHKEQLDL
ncbi:hypothetical protein D0865_07044 [Hortaea werneckii]|uniref:DUF7779 domain-containing protein n=1 Tax=Hortaea werneckii TaxID=91943 RepID=A0A3M7CDM0_HORWE|nr:hypothetical protein D0865_07044 [Hortaea werneckii]